MSVNHSGKYRVDALIRSRDSHSLEDLENEDLKNSIANSEK